MTDNDIVLNLLDFYKQKGVDLHRILDDPTFKSLSRDTQLHAIKMYAQRILDGTPQSLGRNDFKSVVRSMLMQSGLGAMSGAATGFGMSKAFVGGKVPLEAVMGGAILGGMGGIANSALGMISTLRDRRFIGEELHNVIHTPTDGNALNVITANNMRGLRSESTNKILDKVRTKIDTNIDSERDKVIKTFVEDHNERLGNRKL